MGINCSMLNYESTLLKYLRPFQNKGNKIKFVNENVFSIPSYLDMASFRMGPEKSPVFVLIR